MAPNTAAAPTILLISLTMSATPVWIATSAKILNSGISGAMAVLIGASALLRFCRISAMVCRPSLLPSEYSSMSNSESAMARNGSSPRAAASAVSPITISMSDTPVFILSKSSGFSSYHARMSSNPSEILLKIGLDMMPASVSKISAARSMRPFMV